MKRLSLLVVCCLAIVFASAQEENVVPEISLSYSEIASADGYFYNVNKGTWEKNMNMINCMQNYFANYQIRTILCGKNSYLLFLYTNVGDVASESILQYQTNETVMNYYLIDSREYQANTYNIDKDGAMSTTKFTILKKGIGKNLEDIEEQCKSICSQALVSDKKNTNYLVFQTQFMKDENKGRFLFFETTQTKKQYSNPFPENCNLNSFFMTNAMFNRAYFETDYNTLYNFIF